MCGRYARFTPQHLYASLFDARDIGNLSPRYNIAPSRAVLVARNSEWGDYRESNRGGRHANIAIGTTTVGQVTIAF